MTTADNHGTITRFFSAFFSGPAVAAGVGAAKESPIFRQFVEFVFLLVKWTLGLAVVVAIALAFYFYHRLDDEVRIAVEARLGRCYPQLRVAVREAQLVHGEGIRVRGLSIVEPNRNGPEEELAFIDELFIHCGTDPRDLAQGKLTNARFTVRKPIVRATRRVDGTWTIAKLLPLPKFGDEPPTGTIEGGIVEITDRLRPMPAKLTATDINVRWTSLEPDAAASNRRPIRFEGTLGGAHVGKVTIDARFDPGGAAWSIDGAVDKLNLSPDLAAALPEPLAAGAAKVGPLRAKADAQFHFAYRAGADPSQPPTFDYRIDGALSEGRIEDQRLPYPVTDLAGKFAFNPTGLSIRDVTARHGAAIVNIEVDRTGLADGCPLRLKASTKRLVLDLKMLELMPDQFRTQWHNFLPAGEVDLDAVLTFDGTTWRPEMTINCVNVSFTYHKFPYRLEQGRGKVDVRDGKLTFDLTALSNSEEVKLVGDFVLDGPRTHGWAEIRGEALRIDERFLRAMPEASQNLARSFHPQGRFNLAMRLWKDAPGDGPMHRHAIVAFRDGVVKYDKFPYPLRDVTGTIEVIDDRWVFHDDLKATNDTGRITMRGELTPHPAGGGELALTFTGRNVPIDDELRDALNPGAQRLFNDMKPRGVLNLDSEVRYQLADKKLDLWVRAVPIEGTASIEPTYFPYRMEKLEGTLTYHAGRLTFEQLRGEHGRTQTSVSGECVIDAQGGWRLQFERMFVDRLSVDRDLLAALPEALRRALVALEPAGTFNLRGTLTMAGGAAQGQPLESQWDVTLDCQNAAINTGVALRSIHGSIALQGRSSAGNFESTGEIKLDSVNYGDYQFTEVLGPLWIDNQQVLLGYWADKRRSITPERHVTGKLYGGSTVADGWVVLGDEPEYAFLASLSRGNLAQVASEHMPGSGRLTGEIFASLDLRGKGKSRNNLLGRGSVQLRNADIYQLPAMVSLLKVVSLRPPTDTAFTQSDINFVLQGDHVYLQRIDLSGDAVSLQGRGELNVADQRMSLVFRTVVGSDASRLPAVKQLLGGASQQIMLIHVDGTLANPQIHREAFPGVNQVLEQLQAELQRPPPPATWQQGTTRVDPPEFAPTQR